MIVRRRGRKMQRLKVIWFFIVSFSVIIWNVSKGNEWHMGFFDFHYGDDKNGMPIRKQLIVKKRCGGFDVYWQDMRAFLNDV